MASLVDVPPLIRYVGDRLAEVLGEIADTFETYVNTGKLPENYKASGQKTKTRKSTGDSSAKPKRALTGYNVFCREAIDQMKKDGIVPTGEEGQEKTYMTMAIAEWKTLSQDEKNFYNAKAKKEPEGAEHRSDGEEQVLGADEAGKADAIAPVTPEAAPTESALTKSPEQHAGQALEAVWNSPPHLQPEQEEAKSAPSIKKKKNKNKKRKAVQLDGEAQSPVAQLPGIRDGDNDEGDGAVIPETQVDDEEGGSVPCTQVEEPESCAPHGLSSERKKKKKNKNKKRKLEAGA